jgi:hypothetical protein
MGKRYLFIMGVQILLFAVVMPAQAQIRIAPVTSIEDIVTCYVGGNKFQYEPDQSLISAQSWTGKTAEAQAMFDKVSGYTELRSNVYTIPVTDKKVNVEICPGDTNYIIYNADWVKALYDETNNSWVLYAVMAHEIGHYVLGHQHTELGSRPEIELEADEYAGKVLAKMGASLQDAQAAFRSEKMKPKSHTHPPINERLKAVEAGWREGGRSSVSASSDNSSDTMPNTLKNAIWLEANTTIKGEPVYLEFEPNGKVRTRTSSELIGYIAANERWYVVGETLQMEQFDLDTKKVLSERRGAIKGDRIEGSYYSFATGTRSRWSLTKINYIPR